MTFRPSDDILEENSSNQQQSLDQSVSLSQGDWQHMFSDSENSNYTWEVGNQWLNSAMVDLPVEEIKAPDLSELLKNDWELSEDKNVDSGEESKVLTDELSQETTDINGTSPVISDEQEENKTVNNEEIIGSNKDGAQDMNLETQILQQDGSDYVDSNKIPDTQRFMIVSSVVWWINSSLDFLVDNDWFNIIEKYKKLSRLFFRWWTLILVVIIGIVCWVFVQVKAGMVDNTQIVDDVSIENKSKWVTETPDELLSSFVSRWVDVSVPYGAVSLDWELINSKSNLILYKWIVLPQLFSIDYNSDDFISLEDFNSKKTTRADIELLVNTLIKKDSIYKNTVNIPNANRLRWTWNKFSWSLKDKFSLSCLSRKRVSDLVCDKFLEKFYDYGKDYDLNEHASELWELIVDLKDQEKDLNPICNMVKEYTLQAGVTSDALISVMDYCWDDDVEYYTKLVNFIDLENSLWQPTLSSKVFDNPDLNAYKLLSAQQSVYKILDWTSLNEDYIRSYLEFVQTLMDKDKGKNRYLSPIYKDILYVFNMDELYQRLVDKGKLSADFSSRINQINNWNSFGSISLLSQLTTSDIVQHESDLTGTISSPKTLEELLSQYDAMDRLKIRETKVVSDDEVEIQTEIVTDKIFKATSWESLKADVVLYRQDDLLYVNGIEIENQSGFTDILDIYLQEWNVTFYAMLNYIDEQVWMWYELASENLEWPSDLCEKFIEREDIDVHTCDDSSISLHKWKIEYNFALTNWVLDSFTISDENLDNIIKDKLDGILFMRDSTPGIITSIIDFTVEAEDENLEKKIETMDQFRIHFKTAPNYVYDVKGKSNMFLVNFTIWDFNLQGYYNVDTHVLSKISYVDCPKPLEIKQLTLEITSENEPQLIEILNNPREFFENANSMVYNKYKKACWWKSK